MKTQITYLNYAEELQSFILDKDEIEKLKEDGIIADICLPSNISQKKSASDKDAIHEIWGNENDEILCVQGHPEDLAASGEKQAQNLYNYVAIRANEYRRNKIN